MSLPSTEGLRSDSLIVPALHARQVQRGGYLTDADLKAIAEEISLPLHRINAVVSFFPHFRREPPPKASVHICRDMACHLRGSADLTKSLCEWANENHGGDVEVCGVSCLGRCDRPPAVMVNDRLIAAGTENRIRETVESILKNETPSFDSDIEHSQKNLGKWSMDFYDGKPRYEIVQTYLQSASDPESVLAALEVANLLGMGGAGGRAYKKWGDVLRAVSTTDEKFIVCNADESEPGTFKDREILLAAPHLTIEGMIIAGLVLGAKYGWIYIRHEYPEQMECCQAEIEYATKVGACGRNIFGSGHDFFINIFPSPGGYICGEQTALIEAMEGKRAEPRIRPPELQTNGLYQQPTLLSNVETFAWVPAILQDGGQWFAEQGYRKGKLAAGSEAKIKGKRLFSVSGDVAHPGVYEVENGITLGQLIDDHCGGMSDDKALVAVALSGPSGGLLPPKIPVQLLSKRFVQSKLPADVDAIDVRDLPLDINVSRVVGYMLGAGIVVYGTGANVLAEAVANSRFFRNESCGKCVPCRIGSEKITQMGERLLGGDVSIDELPGLKTTASQLGDVMTTTSICGLGQVAAAPIQSVFKAFPQVAKQACDSKSNRK